MAEEGDVRLRQLALGHPGVAVLLEPLERHRAEQLLGSREAGEQPLEVARPADAAAQFVGELALARPRRPHDEHVAPGQQGAQQPVHHLLSLQELFAQLTSNPLQGRRDLVHVSSGTPRVRPPTSA